LIIASDVLETTLVLQDYAVVRDSIRRGWIILRQQKSLKVEFSVEFGETTW